MATVGNFSRICDLDFERLDDRRFLDWKAVLAEATDEAGFRLG